MSHTPEQARLLWCPMVRASNGNDYSANCGNIEPDRTPGYARCIADKCAMWRWEYMTASVPVEVQGAGHDMARTFETRVVRTHGYCGLAGRPEVSA